MESNQNNTVAENTPIAVQIVKPKKPIFKKWWFWVIIVYVLAVISSMAANNSPQKETGNNTNGSVATEQQGKETFALNETAVFTSIKVTADKLETSSGTGFLTPDEGKVFVGIQFTVENISDEDKAISSWLLFDAYVDGMKCDYSITANSEFSEGTLDGTIAPGKKMVGYYAVEAPVDWQEIELQVKSSWHSSSKAIFLFNK